MRDRVRIRHFEAAFLQVVAIIEDGAADEKCALRINYDPYVGRLDHDVAVGRAIDQIHLVLQPGAAAADHRHAQCPLGAPLLLQERDEFARGVLRHFDETLIADLEFDFARGRRGCGHEGIYAASRHVAKWRRAISSTSCKVDMR